MCFGTTMSACRSSVSIADGKCFPPGPGRRDACERANLIVWSVGLRGRLAAGKVAENLRTADRSHGVEGGFATVLESARFLRVSRAKLYQLMEARELAYAKFGKSRRIPVSALLEY